MIKSAALEDIRKYIKRRLSYAQYRVGTTWYKVPLGEVVILSSGVVRVKIKIKTSGVTINCMAVYNALGEQWAEQNCNIVIDKSQTGALFWFDFTISEGGNE